jgi:peptide/nickel transport system substrate-binding protein
MGHQSELASLVRALHLHNRRLPRREVLKRATALGLGAPAIAGVLGTSPLAGSAAARAQEPVPGGELGVGIPIEPSILDPHVGSSRYDTVVCRMLFDSLVYRTDEGEYIPHLATGWETSDDGLVWTFTLRDDVTFHDGTPFNAEAAKFSFDRMVNPETASQAAAGQLGPYESSEVVDEFTLQMNFSAPYAAFLYNLSGVYLSPASPTAIEELGADFGTNPVGTGPFRFIEWVPQSHIAIERNPDYAWGPEGFHSGPAYLDGVRFTFIPEESQRVAALETGQTDVILYAPARDVAYMTDAGFGSEAIEVAGIAQVCIVNSENGATSDLAVRQAINHAVDQQTIIDVINQGVGAPLHNVISPGVWGYDPAMAEMYPYDPAKAAELLEGAGWTGEGIRQKDGQPLEILWIHFPNRTPGVPELVQGQLREVGIEMAIEALDNPGNMTRARAGEHNLEWMTWASLDPTILRVLFHSENAGDGWNYAFYVDPELDETLEAIDTTVDADARLEHVQRAQQIIMEQALVLPLQVDTNVVMWSPRTQNLKVVGFTPLLYDTSISEG